MFGIDGQFEIALDASRFANNGEALAVAKNVADHAEKRRKEYRKKEEPIKLGLFGVDGYWSDSVPWYEWMTELQVLEACANECGLKTHELATLIAYQIRPLNWKVFAWIGMALEGRVHEHRMQLAAALYSSKLNDERNKKRAAASSAGRASGKSRSETARCTPELVAREYQSLMATGTEERNVAAKLATRLNVSADYIRKLRRQAGN